MKKFILGVIVGAILLSGGYFYLRPDIKLHMDVGRLLDQDTIFLKDGEVIRGWVLQEQGNDLLIETKNGTFTLDRRLSKGIERDTLMRYIRQLM